MEARQVKSSQKSLAAHTSPTVRIGSLLVAQRQSPARLCHLSCPKGRRGRGDVGASRWLVATDCGLARPGPAWRGAERGAAVRGVGGAEHGASLM